MISERSRRASRDSPPAPDPSPTPPSIEGETLLLGIEGEALEHGLKRVALAQLDQAIATLAGSTGELPGSSGKLDRKTVHETRKTIKRLRALLRILRPQLGAKRYRRADGALRDAGRRLAPARDAEVLVNTLDELLAHRPKRLRRRTGVARLRALLVDERERAAAQAFGGGDSLDPTLDELRDARSTIAAWRPRGNGLKSARTGLRDLYGQGRRRMRTARRKRSTTAMHDWRKRVKDLRYAAELLSPETGPPATGAKAGTRILSFKATRRLRRVARRADRLGELLGDEHDLALLAARIDKEKRCFAGEQATRKRLLKLIARRRRRLRHEALDLGARLYRRRPREFATRVTHKRRS